MDGHFLHKKSIPWKYPARIIDGIYQIDDNDFMDQLSDQLESLKKDIGFTECMIEIEEFFDDDEWVGIEEPENEDCAYILWWAKDYWMSSEGEVEST